MNEAVVTGSNFKVVVGTVNVNGTPGVLVRDTNAQNSPILIASIKPILGGSKYSIISISTMGMWDLPRKYCNLGIVRVRVKSSTNLR